MKSRSLSSASALLSLGALGLLGLAGCQPKTSASSAGGQPDTVATVGDTQITRADFYKYLEAEGGAKILPYIIDTNLIFEDAKKSGITISDADVDAEFERRKAGDPNLTNVVSNGGSIVDVIKEQIRREMSVQRLLTKDVKEPTDAQLKSFLTTYHQYYDDDAKIKDGRLFTSTKARADAMFRSLQSKSKTFEQLVDEQKKSTTDRVGAQSTAGTGQYEALQNFEPKLAAKLKTAKVGSLVGPEQINVGLPTPIFVIFKITENQPAKKADLSFLRPELTIDYKMTQAAETEIKKNPANPPMAQTISRTGDFLRSQNPMGKPKLRDILTYVLSPASQNLISGLRNAGTVQIQDPAYAKVGEVYKAAPAPGAASGTTPAAGATAGTSPAAGASPAATAAK